MAPIAALEVEQRNGPGSSPRVPGHAVYFHTDLFTHFARTLGKPAGGRWDLAKNADGVATVDMPVLPEGEFEHPWWGTLTWDKNVFGDMIRNFHAGVTTVPFLNLDHAGLGLFGDGAAPAAGWFVDLVHDAEAGLLKAPTELTDLGEESLSTRRYRYNSAEVWDDFTNSRGETFKNVCTGNALTNRPFHDTLPGQFGQPARKAIRLFSKGPYTLWTPGEYVSPEEAQAMGVPGLPRPTQFQIPFSQLPAGSVVSHQVVVGGKPLAEESTMAPVPEKNGAAPAATQEKMLAASVIGDGVIVTPEPEVDDDPETAADPGDDPAALEAAGEPIVLDTGAGGEGEDDGPVTLTRGQLAELQRQAAAGAEANRLLLRSAAEQKVARFVSCGVIPRKKSAAALEIALEAPALFDKYFADLPPCLPLARVGSAGDGTHGANPGDGEPGDANADTFAGKVAALRRERPSMSVTDAMAEIASDHPELFNRHRAETRGQSSKNGRTRA